MAKNYSYPRVTMSTVAKKHSHNRVNVPDTTILFAPLWTEKGPDDQAVKVHSLAEFIDVFGSLNEDFYNYNGQQALNVYNWLNNGGTLLVKRLVMGVHEEKTESVDGKEKKVFTFKCEDFLAASKELNYYTVGDSLTIDSDTGIVSLSEGSALYIVKKDNTFKFKNYGNSITLTVEHSVMIDGKHYSWQSPGIYGYDDDGTPVSINIYKYIYNHMPDGEVIVRDGKIYAIPEGLGKETTGDILSRPAIKAKYYGNYYKDLEIELSFVAKKNTDIYFNILIKKDNIVLEKFLQKTVKTYLTALSKSEYISIDNLDLSAEIASLEAQTSISIKLDAGSRVHYSYYKVCSSIKDFYSYRVEHILANRLETPIDIILDAGYNNDIKKAIADFVRNNSDTAMRPDIVAIFDTYELKGKLTQPEYRKTGKTELHGDSAYTPTNIALYEQYFTVNDATFTGQNIYVTPTYFLSKLLPYNDTTYGIQYPTAGLRRGILDDALAVNKNPDADTKELWFKERINYVEKTSREYALMSQRTFDGSDDYDYTALSFLNNERVLEKMKKELEAIGRSYLHEFNDAVTIANMTVALNKYVSNWISNRTLSLGVVEVVQNEESENALDINLTIRFTNTIEVINVSIVIE